MPVVMFLNPKLPVEVPVLNGFGDMLGLDVRGISQVGDGARNLEDAVVGPGTEI